MLFSFLMCLTFCSDFFRHWENGVVGNLKLISKFMTLQTGKQAIENPILPNILRKKGNKIVTFCHLIEYKGKNSFQK